MPVPTFPNQQNQQSLQHWMIKYVQTRVTTPKKLIIVQNLMEALSMKAMLTTLRMKGLRWVDDKISNTLTKCWCSFLKMNFSLSIAVILFWSIQRNLYNFLIFFVPYSCSRVPCRCSCFESCNFPASSCCFCLSFHFSSHTFIYLQDTVVHCFSYQLSYQTKCEHYAHRIHF